MMSVETEKNVKSIVGRIFGENVVNFTGLRDRRWRICDVRKGA